MLRRAGAAKLQAAVDQWRAAQEAAARRSGAEWLLGLETGLLGRLLTPVQRWRATAARVVAHLRTGRVRARDGYPAGRIWALVLHACSGAPPYHPRSATPAVLL